MTGVPMPATVVLIVCKTVLVGEPDPNAGWTGHENRQWDYTDSVMHCRRKEIKMSPLSAASAPFTLKRCQREGFMMGVRWNEQNKGSDYRFWRVACPVPIVDTRTGDVIAWKMPECGNRETVVCDVDVEI